MPVPVTESTLSASYLAQFIAYQYSLGDDVSCSLLRTGMNHLYLVKNREIKFVFRIYTLNWRTKEEIAEEQRLLVMLKNNQIPVSYPVPDKSDQYIQEIDAPEGLRYGVLFSFAEGSKNPRLAAQSCYHIGKIMARMHSVTVNFAMRRVNYNADILLREPIKQVHSLFSSESPERNFIDRLADHLYKELKGIKEAEVQKGIVHLDLWFDNIHFRNEEDITIFDFDFCGNGWLVMDISFFLHQLLVTNPNEQDYNEKAAKFLDGYETIKKLTDEERRIIPVLSLAIMVFYFGVQCIKFETWSNIFMNEDHFKRYVGMLKRWMEFHKITLEEH